MGTWGGTGGSLVGGSQGQTAELQRLMEKCNFVLREEAGYLVHRGPQVRREADHSLDRSLGWSVPVKPPPLHRPYP